MHSAPISCSIVLYNHSPDYLRNLLYDLQQLDCIGRIYLVDNSPQPCSNNAFNHPKIEYIFANKNLGYGKAHNIALRKSLSEFSYHIVLNPDIQLLDGSILAMLAYMQSHPHIGLLMPKVLYPNQQLQYLCKLLPTPFDLIFRRFLPQSIASGLPRANRYELRHKKYDQTMEVPNLSGCFMFLRTEALLFTGLFDERFFMYLEDTDLSRRIHMQFQTIYFPEAAVVHQYEKGSYKNMRLLLYHIQSAFSYFNKWGWFQDAIRDDINEQMV